MGHHGLHTERHAGHPGARQRGEALGRASSGLHSTVTSAPGARGDGVEDRRPAARRARRDGVPPPKNTLVAAGSPSSRAARRSLGDARLGVRRHQVVTVGPCREGAVVATRRAERDVDVEPERRRHRRPGVPTRHRGLLGRGARTHAAQPPVEMDLHRLGGQIGHLAGQRRRPAPPGPRPVRRPGCGAPVRVPPQRSAGRSGTNRHSTPPWTRSKATSPSALAARHALVEHRCRALESEDLQAEGGNEERGVVERRGNAEPPPPSRTDGDWRGAPGRAGRRPRARCRPWPPVRGPRVPSGRCR